jgi:hypothetical protein
MGQLLELTEAIRFLILLLPQVAVVALPVIVRVQVGALVLAVLVAVVGTGLTRPLVLVRQIRVLPVALVAAVHLMAAVAAVPVRLAEPTMMDLIHKVAATVFSHLLLGQQFTVPVAVLLQITIRHLTSPAV